MVTATPRHKRERVKQLEETYLQRINLLTAAYRMEIRKIMENVEKRKVEAVRKKLKNSI